MKSVSMPLNKFLFCDLVSSFNLFIIYKRVTQLILFVLLLHTVMLALQLQKGVCNLVSFQVVFTCTYLKFQQHSEFFRGINLKENNVCQSLLSFLHVVTFKICVLNHSCSLSCLPELSLVRDLAIQMSFHRLSSVFFISSGAFLRNRRMPYLDDI